MGVAQRDMRQAAVTPELRERLVGQGIAGIDLQRALEITVGTVEHAPAGVLGRHGTIRGRRRGRDRRRDRVLEWGVDALERLDGRALRPRLGGETSHGGHERFERGGRGPRYRDGGLWRCRRWSGGLRGGRITPRRDGDRPSRAAGRHRNRHRDDRSSGPAPSPTTPVRHASRPHRLRSWSCSIPPSPRFPRGSGASACTAPPARRAPRPARL